MRRIRNGLAACILVGITLGFSGGCARALFPKDSPRTQFEAQQMMRGRVAPLTEPDVFGNPQPALRSRLSQHHY